MVLDYYFGRPAALLSAERVVPKEAGARRHGAGVQAGERFIRRYGSPPPGVQTRPYGRPYNLKDPAE